MEIKGLATQFAAAKARIAAARAATVNFDTTVSSFVSDLEDVTTQVAAMHSDLTFEAQTLGNGGPVGNSAAPATPGTSSPVGAQPAETAQMPKATGA